MQVSIVIPALNEEEYLGKTLANILRTDPGVEVIVVDGGSSDQTVPIARDAGVRVLECAPGRAQQMNAGAAAATGDRLLFVHSDTRLPEGAIEAVQSQYLPWGRFDVFVIGNHWMFPIISFFINLRSRWSRIATGDQAIFVDRDLFNRIGGFPDQPLMEDVELSRRLKAVAAPACLRLKVRTSGRRWETRGVWRTVFLMWRLRWAYWCGARPEDLARVYR